MIKRLFVAVAAVFVVASASGQQQMIADKVIAVVGNQPVLYSEVVAHSRTLTEHYRSQNFTSDRDPMAEALESLLEQKLLFIRAQLDSIGLENLAGRIAAMAEDNVQAAVDAAGSIKALENERHKPLFEIKEDTRSEIEEYFGADQMRSHLAGQVKVTPGEVDRFYRHIDRDSLPIIPEQYVYAQITKLPDNVELAKQRARDRLLELRQRVIDGERFDRLAIMYSVDGGSAIRGGEMDPAPKEQFVGAFADALGKLQPGQVSGVVETEYGFHLIQLLDKPAENLYHLRHILIKPSYTIDEQASTLDFLDSLSGVIRREELTFAEAALRHSDDEASRQNGGVVTNQAMLFRFTGNSDPSATRTRFVRDNIEATDAQQLIRLAEGEISRPFMGRDVNMDEMAKIVKLVEIVPAHTADLSQDWLDIEAMALARKQEENYQRWLNEKISTMYVRIDPMFRPEDFKNPKWFK